MIGGDLISQLPTGLARRCHRPRRCVLLPVSRHGEGNPGRGSTRDLDRPACCAPLHWLRLRGCRAWRGLLRHRAIGRGSARCAVWRHALLPVLLVAMGMPWSSAPALAKSRSGSAVPRAGGQSPWAPLVAEAAARFAVPEAWLAAVLAAESGGDPAAVSPAGAMGLMQLMPATWRALSRTYNLGKDPFAPRANILAGAAYLRALHDRYGSPGFLAAYNAGPSRYEAYRSGLRPLPAETLRYVARLATRLALPGDLGTTPPAARETLAVVPDWRAAPLFASAPQPAGTTQPTHNATVDALPSVPRDSLYPNATGSSQP